MITCAGLWAGCTSPASKQVAVTPAPDSPFVGSEACGECHAEIFAKQSKSHHALTLAPMSPEWAAAHLDTKTHLTDKQTGLEYVLEEKDGAYFQVTRRDGVEVARAKLDYLLGSGHHGVSPMALDDEGWKYVALSYYAKGGWTFSPMHDVGGPDERAKNAAGWPVSTGEVRKCFTCHSTRIEFAGDKIDPAQTELGVRCESCHGPGRAHSEAMRSGGAATTDRKITDPKKWSTPSYMALCQQCHNENSTLDGVMFGIPDDPADPAIAKFHVDGLVRSPCYKKSAGKLRCSTCHDPHDSAKEEPAFYNARCLSCHQPQTPKQKPCPVNPKTGCTSCHMPKVEVAKFTKFADHWIRAKSPFTKGMPAKR